MQTISTEFSRAMLAVTHREVLDLEPHIKTPMKAMSCYCIDHAKRYFCQITHAGETIFEREVSGVDAYSARSAAWNLYLSKYDDVNCTSCDAIVIGHETNADGVCEICVHKGFVGTDTAPAEQATDPRDRTQ